MDARRAAQLLKPYFSMLPEEVRNELRIVTPSDLTIPCLLHISKDPSLTRFVPSISRRGMRSENRTVTRVSTATTLAGCLIGYASDLNDFLTRDDGLKVDASKRVKFLGGYTIYGFRFDVALRPSRKLVPDVEQSDEHWLVPYDQQHVAYQPEVLGKVFYESVKYRLANGKPVSEIEMYVEVATPEPIWMDGRNKLEQGHWHVKTVGMHETKRWDRIPVMEIEATDPDTYLSVKRNVASMLSLESFMPAAASW